MLVKGANGGYGKCMRGVANNNTGSFLNLFVYYVKILNRWSAGIFR